MKMTDYSVCLSGSCEWLQALNDKVRLVFGRLDRSLSVPQPARSGSGALGTSSFSRRKHITPSRRQSSPAPKDTDHWLVLRVTTPRSHAHGTTCRPTSFSLMAMFSCSF